MLHIAMIVATCHSNMQNKNGNQNILYFGFRSCFAYIEGLLANFTDKFLFGTKIATICHSMAYFII